MSNTQLRVISALVLATIAGISLYSGTTMTLVLIGVISILIIDEVFCHFLKRKRFSVNYFFTQMSFFLPYSYLFFINKSQELRFIFIYGSLVLNFLLIFYLFFVNMDSHLLKTISKKCPQVSSLIVLLPIISLASLLFFSNWQSFLMILLLINFGMDTGAWLFGKNFGKRKLWKQVSPNKTVEGLIGGMLTASLVGSLGWFLLLGNVSIKHLLIFSFLGAMSQVGDLIQSKMKRQVEIKDSSSLIPGHGGVYDRMDSLIFLSPFYGILLKINLL